MELAAGHNDDNGNDNDDDDGVALSTSTTLATSQNTATETLSPAVLSDVRTSQTTPTLSNAISRATPTPSVTATLIANPEETFLMRLGGSSSSDAGHGASIEVGQYACETNVDLALLTSILSAHMV